MMHGAAALASLLAIYAATGTDAGQRIGTDAGQRIVFQQQSKFSTVFVVDEGPYRYLRFNQPRGDDQSMQDRRDPASVPMEYVRFMALGLLHMSAEPGRTLLIGLGGGTFPSLLHRLYPAITIDVVEIDPLVLDVAQRFFGFTTDPRLRVHIADGRAYVSGAEARYDQVVIDAYSGDGIPSHLMTLEFFQAVRACLLPKGLVVANVSANDKAEERDLLATMAAVYPHMRCFQVQESANLIVVGAMVPLVRPLTLAFRAKAMDQGGRVPFALALILVHRVTCPGGPARILRDQVGHEVDKG